MKYLKIKKESIMNKEVEFNKMGSSLFHVGHCCPSKFGIAITGCYVMVFFVFPDKKVRLNPAVQTN